MSFFTIFLKEYLKNPIFIISLFIIPITTCVTSYMITSENENSFCVTLYFEEDNEMNRRISENLLENKEITFIIAEDRDELVEDIVNQHSVVGYIFPKGLEEELNELNLKKIISSVNLEGSMYLKFTNVIVYSAVYQEITPYLAKNKLNFYDIEAEYGDLYDQIKSYDNYFESIIVSNHLEVQLEDTHKYSSLIFGEICILLTILSFITTIFSYNVRKDAPFIHVLGNLQLQFYITAPIYFLSTISGILSIFTLQIIGEEYHIVYEILRIICFQITLFLFNYVVAQLVSIYLFILFLPFSVIFIVVTHPIFLDITLYFTNIRNYIRFLPTYQYLDFQVFEWMKIFLLLTFLTYLLNRKSEVCLLRKFK